MTELLEKAFAAASRLSKEAQDSLAAAILSEVGAVPMWAESFDKSHAVLESLADEALEEHRAGRTLPLDPEQI